MSNPSPLQDVKFVTVSEMAQMCRVSKMTIYRAVHSGEVQAIRVGRSFRIREEAARKVAESGFYQQQNL